MPQSSTLYVGLEVHQESLAVAYVAQEPHAEVISLGHIGTRQCESDTLICRLQSTSPHPVFVSAAGPCGSWLYHYLTPKGQVCWGVASSGERRQPGATTQAGKTQAHRALVEGAWASR